MSEMSRAIAAKQAEIKTLQADLEALQRAASILGASIGRGKRSRTAATPKRRRRRMPAAARKAVSKRMKAYWAKKKRKS